MVSSKGRKSIYEASLFFIFFASAILVSFSALLFFQDSRNVYVFISYVKELLRDFRRSWIQVLK